MRRRCPGARAAESAAGVRALILHCMRPLAVEFSYEIEILECSRRNVW
jgi:hypothetical protein